MFTPATIRRTQVAFAALLGFAVCTPTYATLITLNDLQTQTEDGQDFNFIFSGLSASDGTGGTLVVHAQGDYDGGTAEALQVSLDGGLFDTGLMGGCVGGTNCQGGDASYDFITLFQSAGNLEFQKTFILGGALLDQILSDGILNVFADNDTSVGLFNPPNFVEVSIAYNDATAVPEPGSLSLIGFAILAFGLIRRWGGTRLRNRGLT